MNRLARVSPLFAVLALAPSAMAVLILGAAMSASWSKDTIVTHADCAPVNTIYVRFSRVGGLTYAGGNLDLVWVYGAPAPIRHDPTSTTGCVGYVQSVFPHSTT